MQRWSSGACPYCPETGPIDPEAGECRANRLRSGAAIEAQHPAEPLDALDYTDCRSRTIIGFDQPIVDALVIPFSVIMGGVLASRLSKRPFPEEDHPAQAFIFD